MPKLAWQYRGRLNVAAVLVGQDFDAASVILGHRDFIRTHIALRKAGILNKSPSQEAPYKITEYTPFRATKDVTERTGFICLIGDSKHQ
jgi:hypothetical protein